MTTLEHTLVGIHVAIACGMHQRFGWPAVALSGVVSNLPDWDGLPMLVNMAKFEAGHRVWGHNFLWITISSLFVAWSQWRFHWLEKLANGMHQYLPQDVMVENRRKVVPYFWLYVLCFTAQTVHLPCDMLVSGGAGLSDWEIRPFWPFDNRGFVLALLPWGDIGPTIILMAGAIVVAKYSGRRSLHAGMTLSALGVYMIIRGLMRGTL
jgi:membrane-bound metal-dependent hydrolase YbcI (DUF457 family)